MAADALRFRFEVDGENFTSAGEASVEVKKKLRQPLPNCAWNGKRQEMRNWLCWIK